MASRNIETQQLSVVICLDCGLLYNYPRFEAIEISELYESYWKKRIEPRDLLEGGLPNAEFRWKTIEREIGESSLIGANLLEIGSAGGAFLQVAKNSGLNVTGVEIDKSCSQFIQKEIGCNVMDMTIEEILSGHFITEQFHIISLFHVLEHILHPVEILSRLRGLLRENGRIVLEVPNTDQPAMGNLEKFFFKEPTHVFYFTGHTIKALLQHAGYKDIVVCSGASNYNGTNGSLLAIAVKGKNKIIQDSQCNRDPDYARVLLRKLRLQRLLWSIRVSFGKIRRFCRKRRSFRQS